jgi:hypothetical protein
MGHRSQNSCTDLFTKLNILRVQYNIYFRFSFKNKGQYIVNLHIQSTVVVVVVVVN